ncbi:MAG: C13 family peptidase [Pseudomonadota bacterium]|nr:C13 family peptidase [Pseudomonadota bacterium]
MGRYLLTLLALLLGVGGGLLLAPHYQLSATGLTPRPVLTFADGAQYTGPLNAEGVAHGWGTLRWNNGDEYQGQFADGLMQGHGSFDSPQRYRYAGQFHQGVMHGQGEIHFSNGSHYSGGFRQGVISGNGIWAVPGDHVYSGQLRHDRYHGRGQIQYDNGDRYQGRFVDGEFHGTGVYITDAGDRYSGDFAGGIFSGKGALTHSDGSEHVGEFDNWRAQGDGVFTDADGNQYIGYFRDGMLDGKGEYLGADGERYQGDFEYQRFHGEGEWWNAAGEHYAGQFRYGVRHGDGTLTRHNPGGDPESYTGTWRQGELVAARGDLTIHTPETLTEHALYQQLPLLEQTLSQVAPGAADRIELFTLALAPYGAEEVFRREINFIETDFQHRFANAAHSIYLSNSRRSLDDRPLATLTSLERSLDTLGQRMNPEQDILFLYITSHGQRDRTIAFNQPGLALADLQADRLREMLDAAGIRWRVLVISACYSGGFIDSLKNANSLIITAAAAERTSFGCADNEDFTYFGDAFFKQALPQSANFAEAFHKADALIQEWEQAEGKTHSQPQLVMGSAITEQLARWRAQAHRATGLAGAPYKTGQ